MGIESLKEFCDVELTEKLDPLKLTEMINRHLPQGLTALTCEEIDLKNKALADTIKKYHVSFPDYRLLQYPGVEEIKHRMEKYNRMHEAIITVEKKGRPQSIDIKHCVRNIELLKNGSLEIEIDSENKKVPRIVDILEHILRLGEREKKALQITKI